MPSGRDIDREPELDLGVSVDRNVRLVVAYDGTDFRGFAESEGVRTVMGELRASVERIVRTSVDLVGAGRTDAGVHAWGQVVSGRLPADTDLARLQHSLNRLCAPAVAVREVEWVGDDFDARFSATARTYRYDLWNHPVPNPRRARTTWHVTHPLALDAMNAASAVLVGQRDFTSFCRRPKVAPDSPEPSLVRVVHAAGWSRPHVDEASPTEASPLVRFEITASSFCHQMVRSIVGTLVEVGAGARPVDSLHDTLRARDRASAGRVAPPTGLTLWHVDYRGVRWDA